MVIVITEVGIPVFHARETLPAALDSLVAQTKKMFLVCLSIDGDGEDYSDIIEEYKRRGLHIRVIYSDINGGPGAARQRVLDTTQCDYLMYLDADDMLMPRAVEVLSRNIHANNMDVIRSSIIREENNDNDKLIAHNAATITWFHGKIYKVSYLRNNNIRFLPDLRVEEDAYFNLIAWNATQNRGELNETTYLWCFNKNSITRIDGLDEYFLKTYNNYIHSQVEGLKTLYNINHEIPDPLVGTTLVNIYSYYMKAKALGAMVDETDQILLVLKDELWVQQFFTKLENWENIINILKPGMVIGKTKIAFFTETFNMWADRLLMKHE